jgi:hypothetical protein
VSYNDLRREYKKLITSIEELMVERNRFLDKRLREIKNTREYELKECASKIEQGAMNPFLYRDFKS